MTQIKKLRATRTEPYKGNEMLRVDDGTDWGVRMSIAKAVKVVRAAEDIIKIAQEAGMLEEALSEDTPVAATTDKEDDEGLFV